MISDTSCSLRAADMESPLPRWPTLLETKGTPSGPGRRQRGPGWHHGADRAHNFPRRRAECRRQGGRRKGARPPMPTGTAPGWGRSDPGIPEALGPALSSDAPEAQPTDPRVWIFAPVPSLVTPGSQAWGEAPVRRGRERPGGPEGALSLAAARHLSA